MRTYPFAAVTGLLVVLMPAFAVAQDQGDVGMTIGHPGSVGVLWHVSDRVAVRPEFQFSYISSESTVGELGLASSSHGWNFAPGVSALFFLQRFNNLRTYFSPRFTFSRSTSSFESDASGSTATSTNKSYSGTASFGTQYSFSDRFSLFAEIGLGATRTTGSSALSSARSSGYQWTTRTGVGAAFYF
jgi:opacity protein-like surface antigen